MARMLPREVELVPEIEQVCQGVIHKSFERSNGLDTVLYKNIPLLFLPAGDYR